jgi:methylornithine synthase
MVSISTSNKLKAILAKPRQGKMPLKEDIVFLLKLNQDDHIQTLFQTARNLRHKHFGDKVFLYGFLYLSTYCRNDCSFCFFRKSNVNSRRYRKNESEIIVAARKLADSGVHLIDLTMGEDPHYFNEDGKGFDAFVKLVGSVQRITGLPIMISPGVIPDHLMKRLAGAGATWYACYQETYQQQLFHQLRPGQNYDARLATKHSAQKWGLLIEEGLLSGVGESLQDIADSILTMRILDADQVRVMNFVPQCGTPMENRIPSDPLRELLTIAVLRLIFPDRLIPASLDVDGLAGLKGRLDAGANVVTSLVPPGQGLAGVAQNALDIEEGKRTSDTVVSALETQGLNAASKDEYHSWIETRRAAVRESDGLKGAAC